MQVSTFSTLLGVLYQLCVPIIYFAVDLGGAIKCDDYETGMKIIHGFFQ